MIKDELAIEPEDATARRAVAPVICYPNDSLPVADLALYHLARKSE